MSDSFGSTSDSVRIDLIAGHRDPRGVVFEPLAADEIGEYRNVHVVVSEPGAIRGNHRHLLGTEVTTALGPVLVRFKEAGVIRDVNVPDGEVWRFHFPPGVAHAFRNIGQRPCILASFNTQAHDPNGGDLVRDVLIEN
jgi:dTDP-4-dehydrorhamnose 3,5-epimerase-like enzyme